ncbi:MAG: hypothetical protein Q9P01_09170 [Anaerolineae bacterium]|nr:hypothetical protein [Anaerolineae bacterium]
MMRLFVVGCSLLFLSVLLAACTSTPPAPVIATPIPNESVAPDDMLNYGLVPGGYRIAVIGAISATTSTNNAIPIEYGAAVNGMRHAGSNESGNVGLRFIAEVESGGEGVLLLEFARNIGTGTHQIGIQSDLNPTPVGATFQASGYAPFNQRVSGTLTLDFINRRSINGEFDVTLLNASGQAVTIRGAFHRLPYTPREEYSIQLSGIYTQLDSEPQFSKGIQGDTRFITLRFTARRAFAEAESGSVIITAQNYRALHTGEYNVLAADSPISVEVRLGDSVVLIQSATVLFVRTSDTRNGIEQSIWQGALTISLMTDAGATTLTGLFNHFDPL